MLKQCVELTWWRVFFGRPDVGPAQGQPHLPLLLQALDDLQRCIHRHCRDSGLYTRRSHLPFQAGIMGSAALSAAARGMQTQPRGCVEGQDKWQAVRQPSACKNS